MANQLSARRGAWLTRVVALAGAAALAVMSVPLAASAMPPDASPKFVQVAASRSDGSLQGVVLGVTDDGRLFSWGRDTTGLLGMGPSVTEQLTPTEVTTLPPFTDAADRIVQVAIGSTHALALTLQGKVYAWGDNSHGQLGVGDTDPHPTPVELEQGMFPNLNFHAITQVSAGGSHSLALGADGQVYAWGANAYGQLGTGDAGTDHSSPQLVMSAGSATAVTAGTNTSFAITPAGGVRGWGANEHGQVGTGEWSWVIHDVPRIVPYFEFMPVKQVTATATATAALTVSGQVYVWGFNDPAYHPLGFSDVRAGTDPLYPYPEWLGDISTLKFPGLNPGETITAISLGQTSGAALTSTGSLMTWGGNVHGQLGLGDQVNRGTPARVATFPAVLDGAPITQISMGDFGMAAVSGTGGVYGVGIHGGSTGDASISPAEYEVSLFSNIRIADLTGTVTLSSAPEPGAEVTALTSGWNAGAVLSYQWRLDGVAIAGATDENYTPAMSDAGHQLSVAVSAVAENFGPGTVVSAASTVAGASAPVITTASLPDLDAGDSFYEPIVTTGTAPITFSGTVPAGFTLNPTTGVLSGSSEVAGDYAVHVVATNAFGSDTADYTLSVLAGDLDHFVLSAAPGSPVVGDEVAVTARGYDEFGNDLGDVTSEVQFESSVPGDEVADNVVTISSTGARTITGTGFEGKTAVLELSVTAADAGPVTPPPADEELSGTGIDAAPIVATAVAMLAAGVALVLAQGARVRRRL